MVQDVWEEKGIPNGTINEEVTKAFAQKLWGGVTDGYGVDLSGVDYDTPDYNMLSSLQENTWHFSAAKNYTQLRELSNALLGADGKLRSFDAFKEEAIKINSNHAGPYLKAEYNFAVAGGQMSSKWVDITGNPATTLLEFDAVLDKRTSEICRPLNGTLLPVNHPFWDMYYPPNHFNCRSTVRQKSRGVVTETSKISTAEIKPMFQTNLAKEKLVFPKGHPYFTETPQDVLEAADNLRKSNAR